MKERFITILELSQQKELIPFLRSLSEAQKKELLPTVKKLVKDYLTGFLVSTGTNTVKFELNATETQRSILVITAFVCFSRADFERVHGSDSILDKKLLYEVIDWYCPDWFSDFVNGQASKEFIIFHLDYFFVVELTERGYLQASKELVARLLPVVIYRSENGETYYVPERLLEHAITLQVHIWYLFEVESNIYYAGRWFRNVIGGAKDDGYSAWGSVFKKYIEEGRLDRRRVLQESLYASNRNLNKLASGWFIDLFCKLDPSREELLALQTELYGVLGSPHSKPVNTVLQFVKKLMSDKSFSLAGFLDHVPVLLSSSTKSVVAATLGILEKLPGDGLMICRAVLQVFVQTDDDLQVKAAKIILTHTATIEQSLKDELAVFSGTMTASTRRLLEDLLDSREGKPTVLPVADELLPATAAVLTPIPVIENIDDLVFLVSQALDGRHAWLIDVVPAALADWVPKLQGASIARLEPALQRALKLKKNGLNNSQGLLDSMLATFLIDVCMWLVRQRGSDAQMLDRLFDAYKQEKNGEVIYWQSIGGATYLANWGAQRKADIYLNHKHLLLLALAMIRQEKRPLPMLCTPTHEPGWIMPEVLVNRLSIYQQAGEWPDEVDFQVAILRCRLVDTAGAIAQAEAQLQGEYLALCLFLFGKYPEPKGILVHPTAWLAASVALPEKKQYAALESFGFYEDPFSWYTGQRGWEAVKGVLNIEYLKEKKKQPVLLYDLFRFEHHYYGNEPNDFLRLFSLTLSNPEPFLALVSREGLKYSTFAEISASKAVIAMLQGLHGVWAKPGNMAHVVVAACMLCNDKTAAGIAAEIWLQQAPPDKIDSTYLGKVIGLLERANYAPLKRFTDRVHQQLVRVSAQHDQLLQMLIEHVLLELPDEPVTNLKKLLEIYLELLDINKSSIGSDVLKGKLRVWERNAAVKKIVSQLITFSA